MCWMPLFPRGEAMLPSFTSSGGAVAPGPVSHPPDGKGLGSLLPAEGHPIQSLRQDPHPSCAGQPDHGLCSCQGLPPLPPGPCPHICKRPMAVGAALWGSQPCCGPSTCGAQCGARSRAVGPAHAGLSVELTAVPRAQHTRGSVWSVCVHHSFQLFRRLTRGKLHC